jgi:hypothetical protein
MQIAAEALCERTPDAFIARSIDILTGEGVQDGGFGETVTNNDIRRIFSNSSSLYNSTFGVT